MNSRSVLFLFTIILFLMTACSETKEISQEEKPTIKIGYLPITHAIPLYMQKELLTGNENFDLELVKFPSWPDLMDALNAKRIDGASALVTVAMRSKEQGINLKAVALGHRDGNVLVASPDIENVQQLKGKTYAIPHKFSSHNILLYMMLENEGVKYDDVNVVEMDPGEMPSALAYGHISGYVVAEPFGAQSVILNRAKVLYQSEELWKHSIDCALVLHDDLIKNNQEIVQEFVDSYVQAGIKAETKDNQIKAVSNKYMDVNDEVMDLSLEWISYDDLKMNQKSYHTLSEFMIKMNLSNNPPSFDEFVDNTFIEKAND